MIPFGAGSGSRMDTLEQVAFGLDLQRPFTAVDAAADAVETDAMLRKAAFSR